MANSFAFRGGS